MRLIDADAWIKKLEQMINDENCSGEMKDYALMFVNEINTEPTAYDINKVIEQLNNLVDIEYNRSESCDENGSGDGEEIYEDGRSQGKFEAYKKALEIVKSGGIDKEKEEAE